MPGWVWILLTLFMIAMLAIGAIYAILHAIRAGKAMGQVGATISQHMPQPPAGEAGRQDQPEGPFFSQSLSKASSRYSQAHADLLRRKNSKRRNHEAVWARWKHFNR